MTRDTRCWWCRQLLDEEWRWVGSQLICGHCWDKADVGPDVPVDYTEEEGAA